ncbi:MAG TPA: nuclear transport factor 2 family protein, partial [Solirubrobacteraceae bacterium]
PRPRRPRGARAADPSRLRVVRAWVKAEAQGRMAKAASYFALPALVANPQPLRLRTRAQVRAFNEALPCGARLTSTYAVRHLVVATFRLVQRPGADCGRGVGGSASTAFVIRDGKIAQWLRVPDQTGGAAPSPRSGGPVQPLAPPQTATGSSGPAGPAI